MECLNQNGQLGRGVNLFHFRFLPCAEPPAVQLQLLGEEDLTNDGQRTVLLNTTLTENGTTAYDVTFSGIVFGTYSTTVNTSSSSCYGIAVSFSGVHVHVTYWPWKIYLSAYSLHCSLLSTFWSPLSNSH